MTDQVFHIYDKNNEVIAHSLDVDELEEIIKKKEIFEKHYEIEVLQNVPDREEPSY
jgi:hypothetical protein